MHEDDVIHHSALTYMTCGHDCGMPLAIFEPYLVPSQSYVRSMPMAISPHFMGPHRYDTAVARH